MFLYLSFDSFLAGIAIGSFRLSANLRAALVAAFAACDGLATIIGANVHLRVPDLPWFSVYLMAALLLLIAAKHSRAVLFALPVLFSLDNFVAGAPVASAVLMGAGSAGMAALGIIVSPLIFGLVRKHLV